MAHRVVIIGGGFGGLEAARTVAKAGSDVDVILIDKRNFHLFQPLLYQVATGGLATANITTPLRHILERHRNVDVRLGTMTGLDPQTREVVLEDRRLGYDTLILAAGSRPHYFGHPEWAAIAPGLKTIEDAELIRSKIFRAFEEAENTTDAAARSAWMTFVIVGGGPTSVEMAGAMAEIARQTLRGEFRGIQPEDARIVLVEADDRVIGQLSTESSTHAQRALEELGVELALHTRVTALDAQGAELTCDGVTRRLESRTIFWGAGVRASAVGGLVGSSLGIALARGGRLAVDDHCAVPDNPHILVIGDLAEFTQDGTPVPGVAQVAMQQGRYVGELIRARLRGKTHPAFTYRSKGDMATIGKRRAVAEVGKWRLHGRLAWLMWLVLHLMKLVRAESRILVFVQWVWYYFSSSRGARIIGEDVAATGADHAGVAAAPSPTTRDADGSSAPAPDSVPAPCK